MALGQQVRGLAGDDALVQRHVDVAAAEQRDGRAPLRMSAAEQRGDADGRGAFDDLALLGVGVADARGDLRFADQQHFVDQVAHHGEGVAVGKADAAAQQAKTQQTAPQAAEMPVNQAAKTAAAPAAETAQNIAAAAQTGAPKETGPAKTGAAPETVPPQPLAARAPMANDPRLQNQAANGKDASAQTGTGEEAKAAKAGTQIAAQTQGALPQQNTAAPQSPQLGLSQPAPLFGAPGSDAPLTSPAGAEGTVGNASTAAVSDGQARFTQLSNMQTGNVVTAPRMTAQVGDALVHAARSGNDKLTLQLFPEELGTVDITLEMQNGRLKIVVAAERPETQQQLQQNQRDLERSLAEAGIDHGNADLSFAEWEGREQREPGTAFERLSFGVAAAEPAETATGQTVSLTPGGIDLRL